MQNSADSSISSGGRSSDSSCHSSHGCCNDDSNKDNSINSIF